MVKRIFALTSCAIQLLGRCLVTGGTGFLGSHVARLLTHLPDVSVHVVDIQVNTVVLHFPRQLIQQVNVTECHQS